MKRLIASVLAALSVLSVSLTAFAADGLKVTKPGQLTYDVVAKKPQIVLKVALPSKLKAAINPYGAEFQVDDLNTIHTNNGIVSIAYPVYNYDTDYGVFFDVTAITSTSSPKKWAVTTEALTAGVKNANMAFTASKTEAGIAAAYSNEKRHVTSFASQGNLPLDSNTTAEGVKGKTSISKFAYVPASTNGTDPNIIYMGFSGALAPDSGSTVVKWIDTDQINISLIMKLTPGPKTLS